MRYYKSQGQLDLTERNAIEIGLCRGDSFKRIAKKLGRHPSTVAHEVKMNRTHVHGQYPAGKDCRFAGQCAERHLCGCDEEDCNTRCRFCKDIDCRTICKRYISVACKKTDSPPYVCNNCNARKKCFKDRYFYNAIYAEAASSRRRSECRQGIRISEEQLEQMDELVTRLVKKGQPLTHIYAEHEKEMPISLRSLYYYIDAGEMTIRNIDLRRKTSYRQRRKNKKDYSNGFGNLDFREGRTYEDFIEYMKSHAEYEVVEMDTVRGCREKGKRLLTMILRKNSIMLLFLMPDGTADSVKRIFDFLEAGLGTERFSRLFGIILTDNGSEFKRVDDLELTEDYVYRCNVFYCDPMASWQKAHVEKNHEYIRYVLRKGKSLNPFEQEDITLLMNHINSTKRKSLGYKSPYELIDEDDEDMWALWSLLKMDLIPADEVHLMPDLFKFNK